MAKCKHGIYIPKGSKYKAEDVCSICRGLPENKIATAILNDDFTILSVDQLNSIVKDPNFDPTVKDYAIEELRGRAYKEMEYEEATEVSRTL